MGGKAKLRRERKASEHQALRSLLEESRSSTRANSNRIGEVAELVRPGVKATRRKQQKELRRGAIVAEAFASALTDLPSDKVTLIYRLFDEAETGCRDTEEVARRLGIREPEVCDLMLTLAERGLYQMYGADDNAWIKRVASHPRRSRLLHEALDLALMRGFCSTEAAFFELPPMRALLAEVPL